MPTTPSTPSPTCSTSWVSELKSRKPNHHNANTSYKVLTSMYKPKRGHPEPHVQTDTETPARHSPSTGERLPHAAGGQHCRQTGVPHAGRLRVSGEGGHPAALRQVPRHHGGERRHPVSRLTLIPQSDSAQTTRRARRWTTSATPSTEPARIGGRGRRAGVLSAPCPVPPSFGGGTSDHAREAHPPIQKMFRSCVRALALVF